MIIAHPFKGQKIGVFGLGKAGEASVASLVAGGAEVFAWDDKYEALGIRDQALERILLTPNAQPLMPYLEWPWEKLNAVVIAPGVPLTHPEPHAVVKLAKKHGVKVMGDIEILYQSQPNAKYIAITGTNGKSTTTTLIGHILKEAGVRVEVGGNLGNAALTLEPLGSPHPNPLPEREGIYVLELSSYQLDLVHTTRFNVAVWLNITPDHLDRHGDMAGYVAAKKHIFDRQTKEDVAVIGVDDAYSKGIRDWALGESAKVVSVSVQQTLEHGVSVVDGVLHDQSSLMPNAHSPMPIGDVPTLTGAHNWQNAAVAYAACRAVGVSPEKIIAAMKTFPGLRHRLQLVKTIRGVRFINDSKATNADAVQHALKPYQNIYWIAGGKAKAGGIESLAPLFSHVTHAFLIGDAEADFAKTLEGKVPYTQCRTLEVAVKKAAEMAFDTPPLSPPLAGGVKGGAVVLLSPACASFDQFKSFEHRGDVFCELVEQIK